MALRTRLAINQTQLLALTPGLRQSIEMMQLSAQDLALLVERKLEENPFLERAEESEGWRSALAADPRDEPLADYLAEAPYGETWQEAEGEGGYGGELSDPGPSLEEYLQQEARLAFARPEELNLALRLIAELDAAGYLPADIAERPAFAQAYLAAVLDRLQRLGPPGLFARSLQECLSLQLRDRGLLDAGFVRLLGLLPLVAAGDATRLARGSGLEEAELLRRLQLLRSLDPKPALAFSPPEAAPAIPELIVTLDGGGEPRVHLNQEALPRLRVNLERRRQLRPGLRRNEDKAFVAGRTAEARWLVRALARRGQTLLALGQELTQRQAPFFRQGYAALRPLTRRSLAAALALSEASVSRLVANKFLAGPQGVLPLRRLFSSALGDGGASAAGASARLAELIAAEPRGLPLSDLALARKLAAEGLPLARRTVTKYRELLKIPPAYQRRRLAWRGRVG